MSRDAFLRDIIALPSDLSVRLIYADWLTDTGTEEDQLYAELIRLQVELAAPPRGDMAGNIRRAFLRVRERTLLNQPYPGTPRRIAWAPALLQRILSHEWWATPRPWEFRRGFIEVVRLRPELWLLHADALCAAMPLRGVVLLGWPDLDFDSPVDHVVHVRFAGHQRIVTIDDNGPVQGHALLLLVLATLLRAEWPRLMFRLPDGTLIKSEESTHAP